MPPPKKPKNGPTREEQFLSGDELTVLGQNTSRPATNKEEARDEPSTTTMTRASSRSPEPASAVSSPSPGSAGKATATAGTIGDISVGSTPHSSVSRSSLTPGQRSSSGERPRKVPAKGARRATAGTSQSVYTQQDRAAHSPAPDAAPTHPPSPSDDAPYGSIPPSSSLRHQHPGSSSTHSALEIEAGGGSVFSQTPTSGRLIDRLISERFPVEITTGGTVPGSAFREHQQRAAWPPRGLPTSHIGQPQVYSPNPRNPSLSYSRLTTSSAFASLVNQQPSWLAIDQAARGLNLRSNVGGIDIQGLQSAASFTVQQQQQHHHHQQQQRRPILASLFSSNISAELTSPPSGDDVFLRRSSSPGGLRPSRSSSSSSSYLSNVMRHVSQTGLRGSAALASAAASHSGGSSGPAHRTESAPVYLHSAFQLPPSSTSSIRKNHSTSTLTPRACSPPSHGATQPLPRQCINPQTAVASPLRQNRTGNELVLQALRGSSGNLITPTNTTLSSNGNGINNNNKNNHNINNNSKEIVTSFRSNSDLNSVSANNNIISSSGSTSYHSRLDDDGSTLLDLSLKGPSGRPVDEEATSMSRPRGSLSRASLGSHGSSSSPPLPPPANTLPRRSSLASSNSPPRQDISGRSPPHRHGSINNSPSRSTPRHGSLGNSSSSPPPMQFLANCGRRSPPSRQGSLESSSPHTPRRGSLGHNSPLSRQSSTSASSPPLASRKPSSLLTALMEQPPSELPRIAGRDTIGSSLTATSGRVSPANSDDSNSYINVTSPVAPGSLLRAPSGSDSSSPPAPQQPPNSVMMTTSSPCPRVNASPHQPQPHRTSELAGLLTQPLSTTLAANSSTSAATSFTSFSSSPKSMLPSTLSSALLAVKKEVGASSSSSPSPLSGPYGLLTCKTEARRPSQDTDSREPSDCKSPKEEGRMVSPSSCMPVLPMGSGAGSGEGGSGSSAAHLQAATSTTPEAGAGPGPPLQPPPHFLLDPHVGLGGSGAGGPGSIGASQPMMKQEVAGTVPGSSMQARLCQVCSDNASGFHYGVWSCEGCKAFFKRSIQGPVDYICPATNTCTIDKHRRKSCQACRLRRCYEVGMNKGSQRKERKNSSAVNVLKGKRCRADSSDAAINSTNNGGASSSKAARRSRSASILEALQRADLPVIESHHNHNEPATRVHLLNTVVQLADKELIYLINWAKTVPGYSDLHMGDQVHLIENCWLEMLWLNCAFRSMEHEGRTLVFAPDFHLDRQQWEITGMGDVLDQVSAVSEQMVHYGLNKEEVLLLQATVLVNAEVRRLGSFEKIQEMRQTILDAFMEVVGRPQGYGSWRHAPSILLLLTHIRQASERGITFFQRLKMEGSVNFCDLITEMLDAHNPSGERRRQLQQQQPQLQQLHHHHLQQQPQHTHGGPPHHQLHQPPPPPQQHHQQQQQALHTPQHQPPVHLHQPPPHARHQMAPE